MVENKTNPENTEASKLVVITFIENLKVWINENIDNKENLIKELNKLIKKEDIEKDIAKYNEIIIEGRELARLIDEDCKDIVDTNYQLSSIMEDVNYKDQISNHQNKFIIGNYNSYKLHNDKELNKDVEYQLNLLIKELSSLLDKEDNINSILNKLYAKFMDYTTLINAFPKNEEDSTVSLFDQIKLATAITCCLSKNIKQDKKFIMLEFDVSGIQNFIFKVTEGDQTKQNIAKLLRGRSFLVSLITNLVSYLFLNLFDLTYPNIIFNTGGGATLLLPNDKIDEINKLIMKIQKELYESYADSITLVCDYIELDNKGLKEFNTENIIKLKSKLERKKLTKYNSLLLNDEFYHSKEVNICDKCSTLNMNNLETCPVCKKSIEISDEITKRTDDFNIIYAIEGSNSSNDENYVGIKLAGMIAKIVNTDDSVSFNNYVETINSIKTGNSRNISTLVPLSNGRILNLEEIVDLLEKNNSQNYGLPKLGILKMDVDNLGAIFAYGLPKGRSLSKTLTLSRWMEKFFGSCLSDICEQTSKEKLGCERNIFYINYAGGDDLVIMGHASAIIELANEINKNFNTFCNNKRINISGGITIQNIKSPVRFGIQEAENQLEQSKNLEGKNGITLLNTTIKFDDLEELIKNKNKYKEKVKKDILSRTLIMNLLTLLEYTLASRNNNEKDWFIKYCRVTPNLQYLISRNINESVTLKELQEVLFKIQSKKDLEGLKKLILCFKLVIMETKN